MHSTHILIHLLLVIKFIRMMDRTIFWLLRQVDCWSNRAGLPPSYDECPPIWCLKKMTMKTESQSDRLFDDSSRV